MQNGNLNVFLTILTLAKIKNDDVISVNVLCFETDNKLLVCYTEVMLVDPSADTEGGISDLEP